LEKSRETHMSWWKRRRSRRPDTKPSPNAERDRIESPNLVDIQLCILGRDDALTIIDAHTSHGWWSEQYLIKFARSRVIAIEPNQENFAKAAARLAPFGDRVELIHATLGASISVADRRPDTCNAAHSAFTFTNNGDGDDPPVLSVPGLLAPHEIDSLTIDHICAERAIEVVDILKMEIKGHEFEALKGAEGMLARGAIRLLLVRVTFVRRQGELPAFGAIAEYLRRFGYGLHSIYEARRDPPIILREAEVIFVAPQMQVRPEIPSSAPIPNETIESVEGYRLPDRFLREAHLQGGATVRAHSPGGQSEPLPDRTPKDPIEVVSILNAIIDTSAEPYLYSLLFHANGEIKGQFREGELVIAEVAITVLSGKVGVVWAGQDHLPLEARERHISAMPGVQRVLVSAPAGHAYHLVFRNVADDSTRTTFKIIGIRTKIIGDSFRRSLSDSGAEALFLRAYARERAGDREGAARLLADAAILAPDHTAALEGQGELLDIAGKTDLAMTKYDAVRKLRAESRAGAPDRCLVLRRRGRFTDQVAAFSSVLDTVKHGAFPYIARGNSFLSEGRVDAALRDYESALELKANLPEVMALKGEALNMLGCYREALEAFNLAVAERPQDPDVLSGRAIAYLAMGKIEAADADWRHQLALLTPGQASARACVALRLADYEAAVPELERALVKEPNDAYWRLYHVTALRRLGRPTPSVDPKGTKGWPSLLLALHAGRLNGDDVLKKADNERRRAEALFQLGILALPRDWEEALRRLTEVVDQSGPDMIEHAAARHELARFRL
jgi:FkbM family methyltransferase